MSGQGALQDSDPEVARAIYDETRRQAGGLELIASENFVSEAVLEAAGSVLTNKYAEGYPGKRYYGGCEFVDVVERLAQDRARRLFGAEHANVQPHSGSGANMAAYLTVLSPGDTILGLDLSSGGHLTHGHPINFSGRLFKIEAYGVDRESERIDYDALEKQAQKVRPKLIIAGASAYPRRLEFDRFRKIADQVGAFLVVDMAHIAGLVAAGLHPSPVPFADFVTTTTHKTLRGPRGGLVLCRSQYAEALDRMVMPGLQGGPLMHIIAAKAVALREADTPGFRQYQERIVANAKELAAELIRLGYRLVSGGTDTHLMLISLVGSDLTGKKAEGVLGQAGITVNKNTVPFDPQKPFITSGLRLGTPAITTRGMGPAEMREIAAFIDTALKHRDEPQVLARVHDEVQTLCERFPLYERRLAAEPMGVV